MTNLQRIANEVNAELSHCQSNAEHVLIDEIHRKALKK